MWNYVIPHFEGFLKNIALTPQQIQDVVTKATNIGIRLHKRYYPDSEPDHSQIRLVGSHGKGTATSGSDVDLLFLLPPDVFFRISDNKSNGQSQLLQEFRSELQGRYSSTEHKADGQVVVSDFSSLKVEVVPALLMNDGTYLICDSNNGGGWRASNPAAERDRIHAVDQFKQNRATHLIKMIKCWKDTHKVPIKSACIEVAVCDFLLQWNTNIQTLPVFWYDWMVRDFFAFLWRCQNMDVKVIGTTDVMALGNAWAKACEKAYVHAVKACEYEQQNLFFSAASEWQDIFGSKHFPMTKTEHIIGVWSYEPARPAFSQPFISR